MRDGRHLPDPGDEDLDKRLRHWRSRLHDMPELACQEFSTQSFLARELRSLGLHPTTIAGTGLMVDLRFGSPGPCIAFRADMDALAFPLTAGAGSPDMTPACVARHACGHDMHMAILLGLAERLVNAGEGLRGTARLLFQPAEELLSTESGAHRCVDGGALSLPHVDRIYALHVSPRFAVGAVALRRGVLMAESGRLTLQVQAAGGHAAEAASRADPMVAMARLLVAVDDECSSRNPADGHVSFCRISGSAAINVRPTMVRADGSVRAARRGSCIDLVERLQQRLSASAARLKGISFHLTYEPAYPLLENHPAATDTLEAALRAAVGADRVMEVESLLASEDFAVYLQQRPGAMFLLGVRGEAAASAVPVHCADFKGDDDALRIGVRCFEAVARRELGAALEPVA